MIPQKRPEPETEMDALAAAGLVRSELVRRCSERCEDVVFGYAWYEQNVEVWSADRVQKYFEAESSGGAPAAVFLEGRPDFERGLENWTGEISMDPGVLARIPGWYMQVESGAIVTFWPL